MLHTTVLSDHPPHTDHRHSGPHRVTDKLFSNTRYFIIKSNNFDNVDIAKDKVSTWTLHTVYALSEAALV